MLKNLKYLATLLVGAFAFGSCTVPDDEVVVPDGVLRIFADKQEIAADGADAVTFKVMFGAKDVSSEKTMHLVREYNGVKTDMEAGANVFSTTASGEYKFTAYLYSGGDKLSDNEIVINARPVESQQTFTKRVLGQQFTSVGCVNCPLLSSVISKIQQERPGVLIPASFHMDFDMADPMSIDATKAFYNSYKFQGLPFFVLDLRNEGKSLTNQKAAIDKAIDDVLANYPATCGVAIDTKLEGNELTIKTKITSNVAARYKYHIFLVEDGIEYAQMGADGNYIHNNVVRMMVAPDINGSNINNKQPFTPGVEVAAQNKVTIKSGWNTKNMRVIVAALTSNDGEKTFTVNNVNECKLGGSVEYEPEVPSKEFKKYVCAMDFTGAWCTFCPSGYSTMNAAITRNEFYKERVHVMAFHSSSGGEDKLAVTETEQIVSDFGLSGYPSFITDFQESGQLDGSGFRQSLEKVFADNPAHCGVALKSEINGENAKVTVKLHSEKSAEYRIAVFVVEDNIKYYQKDGSTVHDSYNHRHVVRQVISKTYKGDRMDGASAVIEKGQEKTKIYEFKVNSDWKKENCYIYALALNSKGVSNNMNVCKLDSGESDYQLEN